MKRMVLLKRDFSSRSRQRGLAMVELAIGAPILLLLLLAIGELGRMFYQYNLLVQSSRDAARYASHHALNNTTGRLDLTAKVKETTLNLARYGLPVESTKGELLPGIMATVDVVGTEHIIVRVSYTFRPVIGNALPTFFGESVPLGVPLVATTVMRAL